MSDIAVKETVPEVVVAPVSAISQTSNPKKPWLFPKGKSGNPSGRRKGEKTWATVIRELGRAQEIDVTLTYPDGGLKQYKVKSDKTIKEAVVAALYEKAISGDVRAIKELADRSEGTAKQSIEVTGNGLNQDTGLTVIIQQALPPQPKTINVMPDALPEGEQCK